MLNLIRKDLLMHKNLFPLIVLLVVPTLILQASRGFSPGFYLTLTCIYGAIPPASIIAIEDRTRVGAFICSLPVSRTQIVRAKYVISWAMAIVLILIGLVLYSLIAAGNFWSIWNVSTFGQILALLSLGFSVTLPILMRYGWWGLIGGFIGMQVLAVIAILFGMAFIPGLQLQNSFIALADFITNSRTRLGAPLFLTSIVVAGAGLNLVSCKVAVMMFERREF